MRLDDHLAGPSLERVLPGARLVLAPASLPRFLGRLLDVPGPCVASVIVTEARAADTEDDRGFSLAAETAPGGTVIFEVLLPPRVRDLWRRRVRIVPHTRVVRAARAGLIHPVQFRPVDLPRVLVTRVEQPRAQAYSSAVSQA